jgi:outer membrane protein OmpA-like peptidoglycan-associated protein
LAGAPLALAEVPLAFTAQSYDLAEAQKAALGQIVEALRSDPNAYVVVREHTAGLKTSALGYIVAKNRALRVFQELVRQGVDPARVTYAPVAAPGAGAPLVVDVATDAAPKSTARLQGGTAQADAPTEFVVSFPSGSAVPTGLSEADFAAFLASVGQPGRDAVVIEGFTDTVGNAAYNKALGELRALSVYERLMRAGLPPYRVDTQSHGASAAKGKGDSAADRRVVVRWQKNEKVAAEAAKVEAPPPAPEPQPEPAPVAQPEPQPAPEPAPQPAPEPAGSTLDIVPFAGVMIPGGDLKDNAKTGGYYGLGIGKAFIEGAAGELRATLFAGTTKLDAKESGLSGPLKIKAFTLRAYYAFGAGAVRPFVGAGLGVYVWDGAIRQKSSGLENEGDESDTGGLVAAGVDVTLTPGLFLEPTLTWQAVGGEFNESLLSATLALRWRI